MKTSKFLFRNSLIALLFIVGLGTTSCENDFEINADWKETIIIYGLLDPLDSIQQIKINKAFLNSAGSAYEVAQNPDSLYLDSTFATLTEVASGRVIQLVKTRVNKDSGLFGNDPVYVWTTREKILPSSEYRVDVVNPLTGTRASAKTWTLGKAAIQGPVFEQSSVFGLGTPYITTVFTPGDNSFAFDVKFHVMVEQISTLDTNQKSRKMYTWNMLNNFKVIPKVRAIHQMPKPAFMQFLASSIPASAETKHRIKWVGCSFYGGNQTLVDYISVNEPSIGIVQKQADYTNVENGFGVFASRVQQKIWYIPLDKNSLPVLQKDSTTKKLNFIQ